MGAFRRAICSVFVGLPGRRFEVVFVVGTGIALAEGSAAIQALTPLSGKRSSRPSFTAGGSGSAWHLRL